MGGCLCGAVRFAVKECSTEVGVCHCSMCRRWASGPVMAVECGDAVEFKGEENIGRYRSSEWAERGFCKICGSNLFYRFAENGHYALSVGAFDDQTAFKMVEQIFIDDKPDYYAFANETITRTGAEVFEMFASSADRNQG